MTRLERITRSPRRLTVALGIFSLAAGTVVLVWPRATVTVLIVILGAHFVIGGIVSILGATADPGGERALSVFAGLISLVAGVLVISRPVETAAFLLAVAASFWVVRGVADLIESLREPAQGPRALAVLSGLISIGAGIVVLAWPDGTLTVLVRVAGVWMVLLGLLWIATGRTTPSPR